MRRAALITATATMLALTAPPASATASGSWAVPTTAATSTAVAAPRTLTVSLRGLPAKSAPTATITGPRGFRQQVRLGTARKTATLRLRTDGVYTVTLGVLGRGAGLRYPDRATTRVTINAKTPRPSVVRRYRPARLTFDGLGTLRLGMTVAQARQADPSLRVRDRHLCVSATSSLADTVVFNPDGRLAFITARKDVLTAEGLGVGDTYAKARSIYRFTRTRLDVNTWDYIAVGRDYRTRPGVDARGSNGPVLGIHFPGAGPADADDTADIRGERVSRLQLDRGQRCFS